MILKRQRPLTSQMVSAIAKSLNFSSTEFRYFDLLVRRDHLLRISHDTSVLDREIKDILVKTPNHSEPELTLDDRTFSMIAKWYHLPIKQLVSTRSFKPSLDWIRKRLRNKLSNYQVREALENLVAVGVIQKDQERGYIPSIAVKQHHAQMIQRAMESIGEQTIEKRELQSWTLCMDPLQIQEAKNALSAFTKDFNLRFGSAEANHVYQLNVQLFEHTEDLP